MSPRAAWRLESIGFTKVRDYVAGKADWGSFGLPLEGTKGPLAGEYVRADKPDLPASLILDVELPDINGLDLQKQIADGDHPPIVFITGHGDIPSSVRAIKHGAVDFLTKPFSDDDLMEAVKAGLAQDR